MYQFNDLFKAVGLLLLVFLGGIAFKKCDQQKEIESKNLKINQSKRYENQIHTIDSTINRIPFVVSDSFRTNFLKNYSKFR